MRDEKHIQNKEIYEKIHLMSNVMRFRILELTQNKSLSITELSSYLNLSYTKCADYVRMLKSVDLVTKTKIGKEVRVRSKIIIYQNKLVL